MCLFFECHGSSNGKGMRLNGAGLIPVHKGNGGWRPRRVIFAASVTKIVESKIEKRAL
ncbi:MAG: hypothetical protein UW09_C0002G0120 [candidate division TM6 bacterium GW2011_GWF2_43_87]|nr:MAG: hypothetical protein UW09_C0002G0120 [candidate division TM6 bacterium GW2011_GWF2_43_87]